MPDGLSRGCSFPALVFLILLSSLAIQEGPIVLLPRAHCGIAFGEVVAPAGISAPAPAWGERLDDSRLREIRSNTPSPAPEATQDECLACHRITTPQVVKEHEQSVHAEAEMGCAGCHGGEASAEDEEVGHSSQKGFRGKISVKEIPALCGDCHDNIERMRPYRLDTGLYREYLSSRHGKLFAQGDLKVATCISCHGVHRILSHKDPRSPTFKRKIPETCGRCHSNEELMRPYGIPSVQVAQYQQGIHGQILSGKLPGKDPALVPTCVDCHGGHGATPPDLKTVHAVCGTCHASEHRYFRKGPHYESARRTGAPKCTNCHGNHRNTIPAGGLLAAVKKNCGACHKEGEEGYRVALALKQILERGERVLADFQKATAAQTANGTGGLFLKGEYARLQNRLSVLKQVTHSTDPQEAQGKLAEMEGAARSALLYQQKVLSQEKAGIGPILLALGGLATGIGLISLAGALLILRWKGRREQGAGHR